MFDVFVSPEAIAFYAAVLTFLAGHLNGKFAFLAGLLAKVADLFRKPPLAGAVVLACLLSAAVPLRAAGTLCGPMEVSSASIAHEPTGKRLVEFKLKGDPTPIVVAVGEKFSINGEPATADDLFAWLPSGTGAVYLEFDRDGNLNFVRKGTPFVRPVPPPCPGGTCPIRPAPQYPLYPVAPPVWSPCPGGRCPIR